MKILVIGGSLYFGKKLTELLLSQRHEVTLLNRGNRDDGFGDRVSRIICDRTDIKKMKGLLEKTHWDVVYDQVCYDYQTAKAACEIFEGKVKHYIFTSSQSVYDAGANLLEDEFSPNTHQFSKEETANSNYAEAKRQAEVGFERHANFPTTYVRFPIVLGKEDYTNRLIFHVNKIKNGEEIFFHNLEASISFIAAKDAAKSLLHIADNNILGPINCCNQGSIKIGELVQLIEQKVNKKVVLANEKSADNSSPYGIDQDWYMSSQKLQQSGLSLTPVKEMVSKVLTMV